MLVPAAIGLVQYGARHSQHQQLQHRQLQHENTLLGKFHRFFARIMARAIDR